MGTSTVGTFHGDVRTEAHVTTVALRERTSAIVSVVITRTAGTLHNYCIIYRSASFCLLVDVLADRDTAHILNSEWHKFAHCIDFSRYRHPRSRSLSATRVSAMLILSDEGRWHFPIQRMSWIDWTSRKVVRFEDRTVAFDFAPVVYNPFPFLNRLLSSSHRFTL